MNELQIFNNEKFGEIRMMEIDGEPWFVATDIAKALGYSNVSDAVKRHVDEDEKGIVKHDTIRGEQSLLIIDEAGLYGLIFSSKLDSAKEFKRWVKKEVLPSIRKTGSYSLSTQNEKQLALMEERVEALEEKLETYEELMSSLPLLPADAEKYQKEIRWKGTALLGGKKSDAYNNASIRGKVFYYLTTDVKKELGFIPEKGKYPGFKNLERSRLNEAIELIRSYRLSNELQNLVDVANCN